ncbi:hypothetical protein FRC09_011221 [Ceratobasidium sp. 395]|nr:hypothetical protein FRC09_011221 [Ceratobasidium sp. 395]
MARFTPTGAHRQQIIDVHPKKGVKLPPTTDHFLKFFSKFGPILDIYHYVATKKSGVDHVFIVFKANDAVPKFKQYWTSKMTTDYWKDSCSVITGVSNAPRELMDRITQHNESSLSKNNLPSAYQEEEEPSRVVETGDDELVESSTSGEPPTSEVKPSKRKREESATGQPKKKKRPLEEPESNESVSSTDSLPATAPEDETTPLDESFIKHMKKEARTPRLSPTPPALELAKQALVLAAKTRKRNLQTKAANDVVSELERLKAERDEARAERDALKAERDEALAQRDAAVAASRESQRELQELKGSIEEQDEKTDEILGLVTASLQSLQRKSRRARE